MMTISRFQSPLWVTLALRLFCGCHGQGQPKANQILVRYVERKTQSSPIQDFKPLKGLLRVTYSEDQAGLHVKETQTDTFDGEMMLSTSSSDSGMTVPLTKIELADAAGHLLTTIESDQINSVLKVSTRNGVALSY